MRKLGMELAGFEPLNTFNPEQVKKMRKFNTVIHSKARQKSKFGKLLDCLDARICEDKIWNDRNKKTNKDHNYK